MNLFSKTAANIAAAASIALAAGAVGVIATAPANAGGYGCVDFGTSVSCHGSDGSGYSGVRSGNSSSGTYRDSNGNYRHETCVQFGSYVSCN